MFSFAAIINFIFSLLGRLGLGKLPWKVIGSVALMLGLAGSHTYAYFHGKSVMRAEIKAAELQKEKENAQAQEQIKAEAGVIEVNTLKDRFNKERDINALTGQKLNALNQELPTIDIKDWTCENLDAQRAQQKKRDEQRARILIEDQWRKFCISSSDPRCVVYK